MRGGSSDLRLFKNERHLIWFHLYHRQRNTGLDSLLARQNQKRKSLVFTTGSSSTCKGYKTREHDLWCGSHGLSQPCKPCGWTMQWTVGGSILKLSLQTSLCDSPLTDQKRQTAGLSCSTSSIHV
ncbi:pyroglutamyl-peptidase [Sarotherodon galilaeus]